MSATGNIYDLGYQGYDGPRLGRGRVTLGLLRSSLQSAYGIGRGGRAKIVPFVLAGLAALPAVIAVGFTAILSQAGPGADTVLQEGSPIRHENYQGVTASLILLFCAAQAPELFGKDQRYGVLPLYFSRVLTKTDYAFARMGGLFVAVFLVALVPHLILSLGAILTATDPVTGLLDEAPEVPRYVAMSAAAAGILGAVAALVAAWTPRRAYATAAIIAVFIIPPIIVGVVSELSANDAARLLIFTSVTDLLEGLNAAIYGSISGSPVVEAAGYPGWIYVAATIAIIAGAVALVLHRYQRVAV